VREFLVQNPDIFFLYFFNACFKLSTTLGLKFHLLFKIEDFKFTLPLNTGYAVAQLVDVLSYEPKGCGFDF
jgi:hypothetical protein